VTPTGTIADGVLTVVGDSVEAVDAPSRPPSMGSSVDVSGKYVLPGLVDIHGDDIERYLSPRPEERIPAGEALRASERAALAAGITTKFHAVAYEDTPDQGRSIERAERLAAAISDRSEQAVIDERIHARCEVCDEASVEAVVERLRKGTGALVSLMNHVPGEGQYDSTAAFSKRYDVAGNETVGAHADGGLEDVVESRSAVPQSTLDRRRSAVVAAARAAGVPVASHDDEDETAVDAAADHGVDISEFPLTLGAAQRATERDLTVAMGAPNVVRGGSLWGNLDARTAVEAGAVDLLCSDFRPQTLLRAAFTDTGEPLHERVARVTAEPARAVGLPDRGRLEPGARADIVVVDPEPNPTVSRVFVSGKEVYRFGAN